MNKKVKELTLEEIKEILNDTLWWFEYMYLKNEEEK